jgi:hypothetical protein
MKYQVGLMNQMTNQTNSGMLPKKKKAETKSQMKELVVSLQI